VDSVDYDCIEDKRSSHFALHLADRDHRNGLHMALGIPSKCTIVLTIQISSLATYRKQVLEHVHRIFGDSLSVKKSSPAFS
jgi:hypothetical protein